MLRARRRPAWWIRDVRRVVVRPPSRSIVGPARPRLERVVVAADSGRRALDLETVPITIELEAIDLVVQGGRFVQKPGCQAVSSSLSGVEEGDLGALP